jgi:hypothetical protein
MFSFLLDVGITVKFRSEVDYKGAYIFCIKIVYVNIANMATTRNFEVISDNFKAVLSTRSQDISAV